MDELAPGNIFVRPDFSRSIRSHDSDFYGLLRISVPTRGRIREREFFLERLAVERIVPKS